MKMVADGFAPTTVNVAMTLANTEYSYTLPTGTRKFMIKLRSATSDMKLNLGKTGSLSGTTYITVPAGGNYFEEFVNSELDTKLYFQSPDALQTAEIMVWGGSA
jgi:hypothetical protein